MCIVETPIHFPASNYPIMENILTLTDKAKTYLNEMISQQTGQEVGLKIAVVPGGCAGFKYFMDFQNKPDPGDQEIQVEGIKIFIDQTSIDYLKGSSLDYIQSLQGSQLKVNNPNAKGSCGCGKSFK